MTRDLSTTHTHKTCDPYMTRDPNMTRHPYTARYSLFAHDDYHDATPHNGVQFPHSLWVKIMHHLLRLVDTCWPSHLLSPALSEHYDVICL